MAYFPGISWMSPEWRIAGMPSSSLGGPLTTYTFSLTKFWPSFKRHLHISNCLYLCLLLREGPYQLLTACHFRLVGWLWNDWYVGSSIYAPGKFLISRLPSWFQGFFLITCFICNASYEGGHGTHNWVYWPVLRQICVGYLINLCPLRTRANNCVMSSFPTFLISVFGCGTEPFTLGMF